MTTDIHQDQTSNQKDTKAPQRALEDLWLDTEVSGEQLIELDPLEETEDLLRIASEATGDFLEWFPLRPPSAILEKIITRVGKKELQAIHGEEELVDFLRRIRGSRQAPLVLHL